MIAFQHLADGGLILATPTAAVSDRFPASHWRRRPDLDVQVATERRAGSRVVIR